MDPVDSGSETLEFIQHLHNYITKKDLEPPAEAVDVERGRVDRISFALQGGEVVQGEALLVVLGHYFGLKVRLDLRWEKMAFVTYRSRV